MKRGDGEQAIADFQQTLRYRPHYFHFETNEDGLANAYLELGRFDAAIAEYQRILRLNPRYPLVHYHLALAYERKGQLERAKSYYGRFLQVWSQADSDIPEVIHARRWMTDK